MEKLPEEMRERMAAMTPAERAQFIAERVRSVAQALGATHSVIVIAVEERPVTQYYTAFHGSGVFVRGLADLGNETVRRVTLIPNTYREKLEGDLRGAGGGAGA